MKTARTKKQNILIVISILIVLYIQHFQLNYSASVGLMNNLRMEVLYQLTGLLIIALPFLLILFLAGNITVAFVGSVVLITALSLADYYTLLYHGSPIMASDLYSFKTALNVISEYSFKPDGFVIRLLIIFLVETAFICFFSFISKKYDKSVRRSQVLAASVLDMALIWFVFFSPYTLFSDNLVTFSWAPSVIKYGYETCFTNSIYSLANKFVVPDGYDAKEIIDQDITEQRTVLAYEEYPDIILILNETLCDLNYCIDLPEGKDALKMINEIPGIISGYSVASLVGGGTNNSEYELLTSNSMSLFNVSAPFQIMDLSDSNSIVSYLSNLGYYSVGMHCGNATNYARSRAYRQLGFDEVYLGADNFTKNYYGNRPWLDIDNYNDMMDFYDSAPDQPRLMYLLSFQNHGGYEQNDPESDTVQISKDFDKYTDDVNEFLTSIRMSAEAFKQLCGYFETRQRPVIILMVGDHAPSFIPSLPYRNEFSNIERKIADRIVPYYVWSNMKLNDNLFPEYSSMIDLVPLVLNASGLPISQYYSSIVKLNEIIPIRTADNYYMEDTGKCDKITYDTEYMDLMQQYWYMEYNNLVKGKDYISNIFILE